MGAIKTSLSSKLTDVLRACVTQYIAPYSRVGIGLSGGLDSVVLLHLFAQIRQEYPLNLTAIHIHHGISRYADSWAQACKELCIKLDIPLQVHSVELNSESKLGLEASARQARYEKFQQQSVDFIALAHHRDDQAETLLLQLLRGAGVKGLSAMPILRQDTHKPAYFRPLLGIDRSTILDWAVQNKLSWVEDDSNQNTQFARNFLRHTVLPLIGQHHPAWRTTLARSAQHMAEAAELLDELAELDASLSIQKNRIDCNCLARLSPARARNLLRYFFAQNKLTMPSQICLAEMLDQLTSASNDASIAIDHHGLTLRKYLQYAYLIKQLPCAVASTRWLWHGEAELDLIELQGTLYFMRGQEAGLDPAKLLDINIRLRQGGEHFRPDCKRPNRRLKNLLQQAHIPPWQRDQIPLIYSGENLIQVPGIGIACGWQAAPGQPAILLEWRPHS